MVKDMSEDKIRELLLKEAKLLCLSVQEAMNKYPYSDMGYTYKNLLYKVDGILIALKVLLGEEYYLRFVSGPGADYPNGVHVEIGKKK